MVVLLSYVYIVYYDGFYLQMSFYTGLGGWYSYRMSKAALNMATRNLSIELSRSRPKVSLEFLSNTYLS